MSDSTTDSTSAANIPAWQQQTYQLYLTSMIAWGIATFALCIDFFTTGMPTDFYFSSPLMGILLMVLALPGLSFFLWQSIKLRDESDPRQAQRTFNRIMSMQHPPGIAGMIGGVLGFVPFVINFGSIFTMSPSDVWINIALLLPWVSLYGFITTYILALVLNKKRKKR